MGKRTLIFNLFTLLFLNQLNAEEFTHRNNGHEFLYGVKISASSAAGNPTDLFNGSLKLTDYRIDSQVGTSVTFQGGIGFDRITLMSGIGLDYSRSTIYVDFNSWEGSGLSPKMGCLSVEMKDIIIPLRLGYTCIDQDPYSMSVFMGPKMRFIPAGSYESTFQSFPSENLTEDPADYLVTGSIGVGVKTGRTFFEFELEHSFNNISKSINDMNGHHSGIIVDRKLNIMTFSVGILL